MPAVRPVPSSLVGRFVRLDPLVDEDLPALHAAIGHPEVFAGGYGGGPGGYRGTVEEFVPWARTYYSWATNIPFAIRVVGGEHDRTLIGTTTLGDFDLAHEATHIGWTAYDPRVWGSQVNAEAKLLLLGHAFDHGFGKVRIQADVLNERSRAAILKLGANFDGLVRRDMRRADGTWRDTAVYSVLVEEWPEVRSGLESRLERWADQPVRFRDATPRSTR